MSENNYTVENTYGVLEDRRFNSTIETSIQNMSQLLQKEQEHRGENIVSRILKKITGISDYCPGQYTNEASLILDELVNDWKSTTIRELSIPQMIIHTPPIHDISDNFPQIYPNLETPSFEFRKKPDMLSEKIQFKLINKKNQHGFELTLVDYEKNEDRPQIYLDNEERIEYLYECGSFMNNLGKGKKIWKFRNTAIYPIASFLTKNIELQKWLYMSGVDTGASLIFYAQIMVLLNEYLKCKDKLMSDEMEGLKLGVKGEEIVNSHLKMYGDEIINLSNIRLEVEGNSIENDNILLTPYGIFVLEVKNFGSTGSYSLKISKDGKWSKLFKNGTTESIEYDATLQNERHARYLQRHINKVLNRTSEDKDYIKVHGLVIIANNEIDIDNDSEQPVFRISEIYRQVSKNKSIFNREELLHIEKIITKYNLPPKKFPRYDYLSEMKENIGVLDIQFDSFKDDYEWGLVVLATYLNNLKKIIHLVLELEERFGYRLIDNNTFLAEINLKSLEQACHHLKES